MMKLWSRVCFLVLVISRTSRGGNSTVTPTPGGDDEGTNVPTVDSSTSKEPSVTEAPSEPTQTNTTHVNSTGLKRQNEERGVISSTTQEVGSSTVAPMTTSGRAAGANTASDAAPSPARGTASAKPGSSSSSSSWGYVILVFIVLVIVILCIILYLLRRVSRTYSFDLQRPPASESTGNFERVYLDDLDRPVAKDEIPTDDLSPAPVANGTSLPSEEKGTNGETVAPQEQPDGTDVEPPPVGDAGPTSAEDPAVQAPSASNSSDSFFDALGGEQQNENNNNPSVRSSDPFVEINLDEPALCDQLLTCPGASSSVLPFSPFAFSSSPS